MSIVNGTATIIPPPEGYIVDFANPKRTLTTETYVLFIVENFLAIVFLAQRLYTKICVMTQFQIDDVTLILAWLLSVATQVILMVGFVTRSIGVHAWEISLDHYGFYSRLILAAPLTYAPCCALAKIVLCIFYSRLSPTRAFQTAVWITAFICAGAYTGIFFSLVFACKPIAASWDPLLLGEAVCVNRGAIYISTAVLGIVTDVLLMCIPIPTVWRLQMPTKQKVGVTMIFGVGSLTMVTSIIRLVVLIPSLTASDQTWVIAEGSMWIIIEANLFIICCCLPTMRRFLRHVAPRFIGESGGSGNKDIADRNRDLQTWGSSGQGPKRQYDTLMHTVDEVEGDGHIALASIRPKAGLQARQTKVQVGDSGFKGDGDSEEAILFERTVHVTSEGGEVTDPYTHHNWTIGQARAV